MSHTSPLSIAKAIREQHVDAWTPVTASNHPYWTRAEKKRVFTAILKRDVAFVARHMEEASAEKSQLERVSAVIILFSYLTNAHFLFQYAKFRDTIWRKMCEFEVNANEMLENINGIANREEYEAQATTRNRLYELLHVIWQLREILRGTNDESFKQE